MLRNAALIPLSRQHQHALALCVRIERALRMNVVDLEVWQAEMEQQYGQEIGFHFAAEEKVLFPAAGRRGILVMLVAELGEEHVQLRKYFARAKERTLDRAELGAFAKLLSEHIRKEERQLFEGLQKVLEAEELRRLGVALEKELASAQRTCILPGLSRR
jgi:hemerythrin-like domain-containing protein